MSFSEHAFGEHKNQMRTEALEKEVQRLRVTSRRQSNTISSLRRKLYFTTFFFLVLISFLFLKGWIQLPGKDKKVKSLNLVAYRQSIIDSLNRQKTAEDTIDRYVYDAHPAAIRKNDFKGIIFSIQIGAYTGIDLDKYEGNLMGIKQDTYEGIHQFTLGEFVDYSEAVEFLEIIRGMGFKDAFIMSFKNGIRINIQDAIASKQREQRNIQAPARHEKRSSDAVVDSQNVGVISSDSLMK